MKLVKMANPVAVTRAALGLGGEVIGVASSVAGSVARQTAQVVVDRLFPELPHEPDVAETAPLEDDLPDDDVSVAPGPTTVPVEPHAPEEPPVDVVGRALAAEARGDQAPTHGAGFAHEPRGASRDDERGEVPWQQAEADEVADEVDAGLEPPL